MYSASLQVLKYMFINLMLKIIENHILVNFQDQEKSKKWIPFQRPRRRPSFWSPTHFYTTTPSTCSKEQLLNPSWPAPQLFIVPHHQLQGHRCFKKDPGSFKLPG